MLGGSIQYLRKFKLMKESEIIYPIESQLEMPRQKPRSLTVSLGYRLTRLGRKLFGSERVLRFHLNGASLLWRLAFEISSEIYEEKFYPHTRALSEDFLRQRIPENGSFIDIGCGFGYWCRIASKYAKTVVGIDYDENKIRQARKQTKAENVEFLVGNVTKDLQDRKFDVALLSHVLEHIDDPDTLLRQLKNVAKTLIVEVPDFENDPLNWVRLKQGCCFYSDSDHVREYTLDSLLAQLERNDWRVTEHERRKGLMLAVAENNQKS